MSLKLLEYVKEIRNYLLTGENKELKLATADLTQSDLNANKLTFGSPMSGLLVSNDGDADFTVTIASKVYIVKPGEIRSLEFNTTFTEATFSAGAIFRANGLMRSG